MKFVKRIIGFIFVMVLTIGLLPNRVLAKSNKIDQRIASMSNEEKIALMIMPSFRKQSGVDINYDNIKDIISSYEFSGVILFAENTPDIDSTMRFIDLLQNANKNHESRLLISIDQEGGYVTRLGVGTNMPGNMALTATNDPKKAYDAAKVIGSELKALGINTNFAPVVDVNNNPANPIIGVRSFSDDADIVSRYATEFMKGLQSEDIATSLKHFPGHGDTSTDTHTNLAIVNKTYDELKNNELIPFQSLINNGTDMIMTAHIQYPNIEKETYVSKSDQNTYTVPATLSKTFLTDILRKDMGYNGVIITDALDMKAIADNFDLIDASVRAINAGTDILLMPYTFDSQYNQLKSYIQSLASMIGNEISEENVNASVKRILELKEKKGLFEAYDNSDLEERIANAKNVVSSKVNHDKEFEIAKNAITMIKNENSVLPLDSEDKTVVLYEYSSHIEAVNNALAKLKSNGIISSGDNVSVYPFYDSTGLPLDVLKTKVADAKNVIMIHSLYGHSDLKDPDLIKMNDLIDYVHENNGKVVVLSTQLPYDVVKFTKADAIALTYVANGIRFNLNDYEKEIPKYGANVIAGIYMLFSTEDNMKGVLPVNIYNVNDENQYTNELLYKRGFGLKYLADADLEELSEIEKQAEKKLKGNKKYSEETFNKLKSIYDNLLTFYEDNEVLLEDKQDEVDNFTKELKKAISELKAIYEIIEGNNQEFKDDDLVIKANGEVVNLVRLDVDGDKLDFANYELKAGSTIVTLKADYLSTLKNGNHKLTFVYNDGQVDASFIIPETINPTSDNIDISPKTGDNVLFYLSLLGVSIVALFGIQTKRKMIE